MKNRPKLQDVFRWTADLSTCAKPVITIPHVLLSVLLASLLAIFVRGLFVQGYLTNDDAGMSMICSGSGWTNAPDPHLMFSNILIGYLLVHLYSVVPSFPWYGSYLFVANLIGITAITYSLLRTHQQVKGACLTLMFFAVVAVPNLCLLSFTTGACLLGFGGLTLIITEYLSLSYTVTPRRVPIISIIGALLLIASSLMRFESHLMVVILSLFYFTIRFFIGKNVFNTKGLFIRVAPICFIVASLIAALALRQFNYSVYANSAGWDDFYQANRLLANFMDYGYGRAATASTIELATKAANWTTNDLTMLHNLFCLDSNRFSVSSMENASSLLKESHYLPLGEALRALLSILASPDVSSMMTAYAFLIIFNRGELFPRYKAILLALSILVLMSVLLIAYKLQSHVYLPLLSFYLIVLLLHFNSTDKMRALSRGRDRVILCISLLLTSWFACVTYQTCIRTGEHYKKGSTAAKNAIAAIKPNDHQLFITWNCSIPSFVLPFDDVHSYFRHFTMLPMAFRASYPLAANTMSVHNITLKHFAQDLMQSEVYLISSPELNALLSTYLREHYQTISDIREIPSAQSNFQLYRVFAKTPVEPVRSKGAL